MLGRVRIWESLGCALLAGCVAHDSSADRAAVRSLVRERDPALSDAVLSDAAPSRTKEPGGAAGPPGSVRQSAPAELHELTSQPLSLDNAVRIALLNNR